MARRRVPTAFNDLETPHLMCRMVGHAWDHSATWVVDRSARELVWECNRCGTSRSDIYTTAGDLDGRSYDHADGYLIRDLSSWGGRRTFNQNVRAVVVTRLSRNARRRPD